MTDINSDGNPNLDIPIEEEISKGTEEKIQLTLEEIEAEVNRRNTEKNKNPDKTNPNHVDPLEINPEEKVRTEEPEVDQRFAGKTVPELIKMYMNVEELQKKQTDELGSLRTENKEFKDKETKAKNFTAQELNEKIAPIMKSWTDEKRTEWFKLFNSQPEAALQQIFKPAIESITATSNNTAEEDRLRKLHINDVVPYVSTEVDSLIAANESWWNKYGTGIFEHAYDVFRNKPDVYDKYATARSQNNNTQAITTTVEKVPLVEGTRPTKLVKKAKELTLEQIQKADETEAMSTIEKELLRRGVKVEKIED